MGYISYALTPETRANIQKYFPPKYPVKKAEHITVLYGVWDDYPVPPENAVIEITGYADDGAGIEAITVTVNGQTHRPNGQPYHVTLSYDEDKMSPQSFSLDSDPAKRKDTPYEASDSNRLIKERGVTPVSVPFQVKAVPHFYWSKADLQEDGTPKPRPATAPLPPPRP